MDDPIKNNIDEDEQNDFVEIEKDWDQLERDYMAELAEGRNQELKSQPNSCQIKTK